MTEKATPLQPGQLVRSLAGRDRGKYYLVWQLRDNAALLVDGRKRLPAHPKAKNPRHLQPVKLVSVDFRAKAAAGKLTPEDIRADLAALLREDPDEEA